MHDCLDPLTKSDLLILSDTYDFKTLINMQEFFFYQTCGFLHTKNLSGISKAKFLKIVKLMKY
jgi:hypothetical protein